MPADLTVSRYMSPCPHVVDSSSSLELAHRVMREHRIRHLPVMQGGAVVGIVSAGDLHLLETLDNVEPDQVPVEDAMTPNPYCVGPSTPLRDAVAAMAANKFGCAVVTQDNDLEGILTTVDALIALADLLGQGEPSA